MAIVLAYSGGLDTSFCVPYLKENYSDSVYTVTVNTGGVSPDEAAQLEERALALGATDHFTIDARDELFQTSLSYLIKGNVLRGEVYPLCVGPERVVQARNVVIIAHQVGAHAVAHGSTGAGNDQVRFDVAFEMLAPDLELIAPIRELELSREASTEYLAERGVTIPPETTSYSINSGIWGTTIGGEETHTTDQPLPDEAFPYTTSPEDAPDDPLQLTIGFEAGIPVSLDGIDLTPVELIEQLHSLGGKHGVGRNIHVGDTILGIKGRVGFEAPAASILIKAHRELEKITLTKWQQSQKKQQADFYGMLLHEGQYFDPVMRDIEAFLDSSQKTVTGEVTVKLYKGSCTVLGCSSPHSMFDAGTATYGEEHTLWDGRDAQGFSKIASVQPRLAKSARQSSTTQNA